VRRSPGKLPFIAIALYFQLLCLPVAGQELKCRHISAGEGLPSPYVNAVFKDSKGFMWFGTPNGLCRYDGYKIKVYCHQSDDSCSLSDNRVLSLNELGDGYLLVGTYDGGLNRLDLKTEKFQPYKHDPGDTASLSNDQVNVIYKDNQGELWIGTQNGLNLFHTVDGTFTSFLQNPDRPISPANQIQSLLRDNSGQLWVGTNGGLFQFDAVGKQFTPVILTAQDSTIRNNPPMINCMIEAHDGSIWIGTTNWLYIFRDGIAHWLGPDTDRSRFPSNKNIMDMVELKIGGEYQLWLASQWGLSKYDFDSRMFNRYYFRSKNREWISGNDIRKLYYDQKGFLWMAIREQGVDVADIKKNPFAHQGQIAGHNFKHAAASFFEDSTGILWVGSHAAGLLKFDRDMNMIARFVPRFPGKKISSNGRILRILVDRDGRIWTVMDGPRYGVFQFDEESGLFYQIPYDTTHGHQAPPHVRDIIEDREGMKWIATEAGLYTMNHADKWDSLLHYTTHAALSKEGIWDVAIDHNGDIWVASQIGLYRCHKVKHDSLTFIECQFTGNIPGSASQIPRYIFENTDNTLWIGTNVTLCKVDRESNSYQPVGERNEWLNDSFIISVTADDQGHLWINNSKGLIRYNPRLKSPSSVRVFDCNDGLPYEGYISTALYRDRCGRIFVPSNYSTPYGFFYFYPDSVYDNTAIPPVVITGFKVHNESFRSDSSISYIRHIRLSHNENYFSLEFAALDYSDTRKNQYAYMLSGLDNDWVYPGNRPFANYSKVPAGHYIFRVKGSNNDGYWNEDGVSLSITVLPPPWKTWWAYLFYGLFTAALVYIWRRYDLKRQRLRQDLKLEQVEAQKLKELDSMKSRFFANISHEFRTPLTLILGPLDKVLSRIHDAQSRQDLGIMQRSALRLQRLINQLLDLSRLESGKMELDATMENIVSMVKNFVQQFESLARQKKIELIFTAEQEEIIAFVDRDKIEKILYNLLSNAFKFTGAGGMVEVCVCTPPQPPPEGGEDRSVITPNNIAVLPFRGRTKGGVVITISDTGKGIPQEHLNRIFDRFYRVDDSYRKDGEGTGIGLALTKELVELHHGVIEVESEVGVGTTFRVYFPVGKPVDSWQSAVGSQKEMVISATSKSKKREAKSDRRTSNIEQQTPNIDNRKSTIENPEPATRNLQLATKKDAPLLLIVEDNADLRLYIRGFLEHDYQVIEAQDGEQGLAHAIEHIPDLVLSDVMMPGMDGYELSRKLKNDERTSHIPVILLTARASTENRIEGLETGADDFITKPFDIDELQARIRNLINNRKQLRKRYLKETGIESLVMSEASTLNQLVSLEQKFIYRAKTIVEKHLSDESFDIPLFSDEMHLSRTQLHRKLSALVGQSASEFIRSIRLSHAARLLEHRTGNISEIALEVGFSNPAYFSECFKKQFGLLPSQYFKRS
jgi:signal transduction histidine kinase/ligand-binding sensor domain-containing protein/DNA-binding response OmpR family regulator